MNDGVGAEPEEEVADVADEEGVAERVDWPNAMLAVGRPGAEVWVSRRGHQTSERQYKRTTVERR